ncbi:HNH endonuclease [Streptomyces sp. NPDC093586]|uniref:HNH endonuclease n=1 Tax=Streptomyces sp. NPDC093586 TaxID=3366042 RepID=UPI0037FB0C35
MTTAQHAIPRGSRAGQPTWVWLMVLTAHQGLCVYCGKTATTLDHEVPVADNGADIWWNFVPACESCNRRKGKRTAKRWVADMDLSHTFPKAGFRTRPMRPEVYAGITKRVERVQREMADADRRDWFRHHYGSDKHKTKADLSKVLERCKAELKSYPHRPWATQKVRDTKADTCVRLMCCAWKHPDAWISGPTMILAEGEREAFRRAAYRARLHEGELLGHLVKQYLAERASGTEQSAP